MEHRTGLPTAEGPGADARQALLNEFDRWWVKRRGLGERAPHGADVWPAYRDGHATGTYQALEGLMDVALAVRHFRRTGDPKPLHAAAEQLERHTPAIHGESNVEHAMRCLRCLMDGREGPITLRAAEQAS